MSFEDAASIPLAAMTALQALRKYDGDLTGKTVLIPAGRMALPPNCNAFSNDIQVSGTGLFACQLAKNVFHAGKVITTVSTSKIPKVKELLGEGTVDEGKHLQFQPSSQLEILTLSSHRLHQVRSTTSDSIWLCRFHFRYGRIFDGIPLFDETKVGMYHLGCNYALRDSAPRFIDFGPST